MLEDGSLEDMTFEEVQERVENLLQQQGVDMSENISGILSDIQADYRMLLSALGDPSLAVHAVQSILIAVSPEGFGPLPFDEEGEDEDELDMLDIQAPSKVWEH